AAPLRGLALTPNASHLLVGGDDKAVTTWNLANAANERTFAGSEGPVHAIRVSANNALVAVGGADKAVRLFNFADAKQLAALTAPAPVRGLAFTPNNLT